MKLLKLIQPFCVNLSSGREDITNFSLDPVNSVIKYSDIVVEEMTSPNYNTVLIQSYLDQNILTLLTVPNPAPTITWTDAITSYAAPISPTPTWQFLWPVSDPITSFSFVQGALISGGPDGSVTITATNIVNGNIVVTLTGYNTPDPGVYSCSILVNEVATAQANLTVEFTSTVHNNT